MWEQRFFTDGKLAPSWGYQVDETASVIYGVYDYYEYKQEAKFLTISFKVIISHPSTIFAQEDDRRVHPDRQSRRDRPFLRSRHR